jgi:hypothetical protein
VFQNSGCYKLGLGKSRDLRKFGGLGLGVEGAGEKWKKGKNAKEKGILLLWIVCVRERDREKEVILYIFPLLQFLSLFSGSVGFSKFTQILHSLFCHLQRFQSSIATLQANRPFGKIKS